VTYMRRGNRELIRRMNRNLVLNLVKSRGPISRAEVARLSGLSQATVSGITAELLQSGLVEEVGSGKSRGGRRPVLLRLNPQAGYVVGVKLMEHAVTSALTDLDANVLLHRVTALPPRSGADSAGATGAPASPDDVLPVILGAIEETIRASDVDRARVLGIGVGMAGLVDGETGLCRYSPFFGWRDVNIAKPIAQHFGLPVYLENDVNTLTIAEQWFGYGHGVDHFVVVTVGRGIGAGLVVNGQFYRGALGGAGELGHITVTENGPPCTCGKRGCLEALASDSAIVRLARAAIARREWTVLADTDHLTLDTIVAVANEGDGVAQRLLADAGHWLGVGIATLVNILNPQLVIVGGEGVRAGKWRLEPMREAIREQVFDGLEEGLQVAIEPSGDETWARGAACVVLGEIFKSPVYQSSEMALVG